jgi:hypothetical protein
MSNQESTYVDGELVLASSIDSRAFWLDVIDRTWRTYLQNLLVFLSAAVTVYDVSWPTALSSAGLAALVTVLMAVSTATAITSGNFWIDTADRAARTFAGTLVGAIPATGTLSDIDWPAVLAFALTTTLASVVTSLLTSNLGPAKGVPSRAPVHTEVIEGVVERQAQAIQVHTANIGDLSIDEALAKAAKRAQHRRGGRL